MTPNHSLIRKQDYQLVLSDLIEHPIWEYALDEEDRNDQDERTVRPFSVSSTLNAAEGLYVVKAIFELADGSKLTGCMKPIRDGPAFVSTVLPYDLLPIILLDTQPIKLCYGVTKPIAATLAQIYERLGRSSSGVFPLQFVADVPLYSGNTVYTVAGFMYFDVGNKGLYELQVSDLRYTV